MFDYIFDYIVGPPFKPIIRKDKSRVTAVSVSLAWEAKFNGGYPQTLSILFGVKGRGLGILTNDLKDPGLGNVVHTQLQNLTGKTCYQFQISSKNEYSGTAISNSDIVELCTKGGIHICMSSASEKMFKIRSDFDSGFTHKDNLFLPLLLLL